MSEIQTLNNKELAALFGDTQPDIRDAEVGSDAHITATAMELRATLKLYFSGNVSSAEIAANPALYEQKMDEVFTLGSNRAVLAQLTPEEQATVANLLSMRVDSDPQAGTHDTMGLPLKPMAETVANLLNRFFPKEIEPERIKAYPAAYEQALHEILELTLQPGVFAQLSPKHKQVVQNLRKMGSTF